MTFCGNCGTEIDQESRFCASCGSSLTDTAIMNPADSNTYSYELPSVSFPDAIKTAFNKYVDFTGRARRSEYWWFFLFVQLVVNLPNLVPVVGPMISLVAWVATIIPSISMATRRLHDIDRTGWWQLLFFAAWIIVIAMTFAGLTFFIVNAIDDSEFDSWMSLAVLGVSGSLMVFGLTVWWIVWFTKKGDFGPNKYGPDPRNPQSKS